MTRCTLSLLTRRIVLFVLATIGCQDSLTPRDQFARELTAELKLPGDGEILTDPNTDSTIAVGTGEATSLMSARAGDRIRVELPFHATQGNVVAAGIRFGDSGPIRTIPVDEALGQTTGTLAFDFEVPRDVCDDLGRICHDIRCYEFAVTSEGEVSQANITRMAMACGNCDEPSCQAVLGECQDPECGANADCGEGMVCDRGVCVGNGALMFTFRWDAQNLDLHVRAPSGTELSFATTPAAGGALDRDDRAGGSGSVENVHFHDLSPGIYEAWVVNYNGATEAT